MEVVSQIFWMSKFGRDALEKELRKRFEKLIESIQPREFHHAGEGLKGNKTRGNSEDLCGLVGSDINRRLAVEYFKVILAEVENLK